MKIVIIIMILCAAFEGVSAQMITLRGGGNLSWYRLPPVDKSMVMPDDYQEGLTKWGGQGGLLAEFPIRGNFSFETGLLLNTKGGGEIRQHRAFGAGVVKYKFDTQSLHVDAPLMIKYGVLLGAGWRIFFGAGIYAGAGVWGWARFQVLEANGRNVSNDPDAKEVRDVEWGKEDGYEGQKRFEFGEIFAVGIENSKAVFGISYMNAATSRFYNNGYDTFRVLNMYFGYRVDVQSLFGE